MPARRTHDGDRHPGRQLDRQQKKITTMKRATTKRTKAGDIVTKFESVTEFLNYIADGTPRGQWKDRQASQYSDDESRKFTTTANFEEADGMFRYGDRVNFGRIQAAGLQDTTAAQIGMKRQRKVYTSVCGFAAHVPNYIAGIPTAMIDQKQIQMKQRVVNIVYNNCYGYTTKAEDVIAANVELLNYIAQVEAAGVRVNLYVCALVSMKHNGDTQGAIIRVKESGQYMDLLKTAYPLVNPSFLRRHMFRFFEVTKGVPYNSCYGGVVNSTNRIKRIAGEAGIDGGLVISARDYIPATDKKAYLEKVFKP